MRDQSSGIVGDAAVNSVSVREQTQVSDNMVLAPSTSSASSSGMNSLILQKLTGIGDKLVLLETRVKQTETVLTGRTTNL